MQSQNNMFVLLIIIILLVLYVGGVFPPQFDKIVIIVLLFLIGYYLWVILSNPVANAPPVVTIDNEEFNPNNATTIHPVNMSLQLPSGYSPDELTVRAGDTVMWKNVDNLVHTVTAQDNSFDSGIIQPNQTYTRVFNTPGRYPYYCTIHPQMTGVVNVQ